MKRIFWRVSLISALLWASIVPLASAQVAGFSAVPVSVSGGKLTMKPGEVKEVTAVFQNTGTQTWKNDGAGYVSLYTQDLKYRTSIFNSGTWLGSTQPARLTEASVAPGKTGSVSFKLKAPATIGSYTEVFQLASEDQAWVGGGKLTIKIEVTNEIKTVSTTTKTTTTTTTSTASPTDGYQATLLMKSANMVKAKAGKSILLSSSFKNTGAKTWNNYGLKYNGSQLVLITGSVKPSGTAAISFSFVVPKTNGTTTAKFQLTADGVDVPGAFVEIPVTVTGGAAAAIDQPVRDDVQTVKLVDEPTIRVGALIIDDETDNEVVITSDQSAFRLEDLDGKVLAELSKGQKVRAWYDGARYLYEIDGVKNRSASALRFVPVEKNAVMTVANFDRRVTRGTANADNTFRNALELRHNGVKDRVWLINELPMEFYLRGLAETSNVSPMEFQKTLLTAARTYAFYHWTRATKHDGEFFHVDAYADQVYNGYGQEARTPNLTAGVEATRGMIVTYQGEIAITPYFSRSDGRTRDWSEVWYGEVKWAKSVKVPCDVGKKLWGHGVGMSASGALCMANDGESWDMILKYFFTGVTIEQRWK